MNQINKQINKYWTSNDFQLQTIQYKNEKNYFKESAWAFEETYGRTTYLGFPSASCPNGALQLQEHP